MMKILLSFIIFVTPLTVLAHPGHGVEEQAHSFLHSEHLILLMAVAAVIAVSKSFK